MPYDALADLPDAVRKLPKHAQEIYLGAFNSAFEQYGKDSTAAAVAWAAVKMKYEQDEGGSWKLKTKEAIMVTKLSNKNKQNLLQAALISSYGLVPDTTIPKKLTIEEVFDAEVIYNVDGQLYQAAYQLGDNGEPSFGDPKKVLSTKVFNPMEALSFENRRTILQVALLSKLKQDDTDYVYIEDMTETDVFYNFDQQSYKAPYTIAEDETITIGEPEKVVRQVAYKTMEVLQTKYADIIQEAGRRNAALDAARVKQILKLCQELLSSEAPDKDEAKGAAKEADAVLDWLKTQPLAKKEDGEQYLIEAFAYTPDREAPSSWRLRLWESLTNKVTRKKLKEASLYLTKGGFSGKRVEVPATELSAVKRRIRSEYRNIGVEEEDIPKWLLEIETREVVLNYTPLTEAKFDKGRATVIVIKAGFNSSEDRYYPAEMLKRDYKIFEGQKMFADHPTEEEDDARPERSIRDWVATLTEVSVDEDGTVTGVAEILEEWLIKKLSSLREKNMLSEMGISINAVGSATKATIDGKETLVIEKLVTARSVDFVTEPGAGGEVTFYETDRSRDVDLVELTAFRERRPDLVESIEAAIREKITGEVKKAMESEGRIKELEGNIDTLTTERDELKEKDEKAVKDKLIAEAQTAIKAAVDKAELPGAAKTRLIERFKDAVSADGIEDAITAEVAYINELSESSKVKRLGPPAEVTDADKKAFKESLKRANPDWSDSQLETAANGR